MDTMKAFAVSEYKPMGDLSALQEYQLAKPNAPTGHDLLVRVKAVATNPIDYKSMANMGNYQEPFPADRPPLVVGWDAAGVVEQVGIETSLFKVGDEVMFAGDLFRPGAFAEFVLVDERIVGSKPKNLTFAQAAALPLTSLTAWEALADHLHISVDDPSTNADKVILITGGAGGTATAAIQIAKKVFGLKVIASASRHQTIQYVKEMGANWVINHREPIAPQIKHELSIDQVDYIMHCADLTSEIFAEFVDVIKPFGRIASIVPSATVNLMQLFMKSVSFSAVLMFTRPPMKNKETKRQHDILQQVSQLTEQGVLVSRQHEDMPLNLANLRKALELQVSSRAIGKSTLFFED